MEIPSSFTVLGQRIRVEWDPELRETHDAVGLTTFSQGLIQLHPPTGEHPYQPSYVEHTFLHELVHCLLFAIAEDRLARDERFVDRLAGVLHQAFATMEYPDGDK